MKTAIEMYEYMAASGYVTGKNRKSYIKALQTVESVLLKNERVKTCFVAPYGYKISRRQRKYRAYKVIYDPVTDIYTNMYPEQHEETLSFKERTKLKKDGRFNVFAITTSRIIFAHKGIFSDNIDTYPRKDLGVFKLTSSRFQTILSIPVLKCATYDFYFNKSFGKFLANDIHLNYIFGRYGEIEEGTR